MSDGSEPPIPAAPPTFRARRRAGCWAVPHRGMGPEVGLGLGLGLATWRTCI